MYAPCHDSKDNVERIFKLEMIKIYPDKAQELSKDCLISCLLDAWPMQLGS